MSQPERAESGWSVVPPQGVSGPRLPDVSEVPGLARRPAVDPVVDAAAESERRPASRAERRERALSMVGLLAGALAGQVEEIGRTADDAVPDGWWFSPSRRG